MVRLLILVKNSYGELLTKHVSDYLNCCFDGSETWWWIAVGERRNTPEVKRLISGDALPHTQMMNFHERLVKEDFLGLWRIINHRITVLGIAGRRTRFSPYSDRATKMGRVALTN